MCCVGRTLTDEFTSVSGDSARLAVLIDAENVPVSIWPVIQRLLPRLGCSWFTRAYACGDTRGWGAIDGVQLVNAGTGARGKNAADFLLAFDAGRIREAGSVDGFVLVTGDDGFAATVKALRDSGVAVHVIIPAIGESYGRRLAQFADTCLLAAPPAIVAVTSNLLAAHRSHSSALSVPLDRAETKEARFVDAFRRCTPDSGGWVHLSKFGAALKSAGVSFKGKLFEVSSLMPVFEVRGPKGLDAAIRLRGGSVSAVQIDENTSVTETGKAVL